MKKCKKDQEVIVYDKYRFPKIVKGIIVSLDDDGDSVEVKTESMCTTVWVFRRQLRKVKKNKKASNKAYKSLMQMCAIDFGLERYQDQMEEYKAAVASYREAVQRYVTAANIKCNKER